MDPKLLCLAALGLYCLGALCLRNTHPYSWSRGEKFESKQKRRLAGTLLLVAATLVLGVAGLTQVLISKN
jgi:hypothetical protein